MNDWRDERSSVVKEGLSKKTKLKVTNATMLPTLVYKCEV